jgi:hypothetical protein
MKINILANMTVQDLKKQFHGFFPYLKIEFFETPYKVATGSNKASMIDNKESIGAMLKSKDGGNIELDSLTTVVSFEQLINDSFGLHVQVFRKSGELYIETTKTDDWTLGQQNAEGKLSCEAHPHEAPEDMTDRDQWT